MCLKEIFLRLSVEIHNRGDYVELFRLGRGGARGRYMGQDRYLVVSRIPTGTGVLSEPGMFYCSKFYLISSCNLGIERNCLSDHQVLEIISEVSKIRGKMFKKVDVRRKKIFYFEKSF